MNFLKTLIFGFSTICIIPNSATALQITNFQSDSFTVDDGTSSFAWSQSPSGLSIEGDFIGNNIGGYLLSPVNISGLDKIQLTGILHGANPLGTFNVILYSEDFTDERVYTSSTSNFSNTSSSFLLTFASETSSFTTIGGVGFEFSILLDDSTSITFESIDAIPEPSVYALSLIGLAGMYLYRRRQTLRRAA